MKTITSLEGVEFLRKINSIRKTIAGPLAKLEIVKTLQVPPILDGTETEEEKMAKARKQTTINMDVLLDRLLDEYPEETIKLLSEFVVLEDGEQPNGIDYVTAAMELFTDKRVIDFLLSLTRLGLLNTGH